MQAVGLYPRYTSDGFSLCSMARTIVTGSQAKMPVIYPANARRFFSATLSNFSGVNWYIQVFDTATPVVLNSVPLASILAEDSKTTCFEMTTGIPIFNRLVVALSTTAAAYTPVDAEALGLGSYSFSFVVTYA